MTLGLPPTTSSPVGNAQQECQAVRPTAHRPPPFTETALHDLVGLFKLLADETRLKILYFLRRSAELNVLELCRRLDQRQPSVSHHLALLRVAGLIEMRREGKHNYYRVLPKRFEELVGLLFCDACGDQAIRFSEYELRYAPVRSEV